MTQRLVATQPESQEASVERRPSKKTLVGMPPVQGHGVAVAPLATTASVSPAQRGNTQPSGTPGMAQAARFAAPPNPQDLPPLSSRGARGRHRERVAVEMRPQDFDTGPKPSALRSGSRRWSPRVLAAGAAALLLSSLVVGFFVLRREPLAALACQLDPNGQTQLLLECPRCQPGSVVYFGDASALMESGRATLDLGGSLPPGDNSIALNLVQPGEPARRQVLAVTVPFALSADWASLNETPPRAAVVVHALSGSAVIVDGQALNLDAFGRARHALDLTQALTGLAAQSAQLMQNVSYAITPPNGPVVRGQLVLNLPIAPLLVEAPGERVVTQSATFMLAGSTLPDAVVTVAGRPIAVDARGAFAQLMNISAPGETSVVVRATAPAHAPRLFSIQLVRTKNLMEFAANTRAERTQSYSALSSGSDNKAGWQVALQGRVLSVTSRGYRNELQMAVNPCLQQECPATISYAGPDTPRAREAVEVFGKVVSRDVAAGNAGPLIEADFFLNRGRER